VTVTGKNNAVATVRVLWGENFLYVLSEVTDPLLNKSSSAVHEQDSVEFFLDENNAKATSYEKDDGQFRVNFANTRSVGSNGRDSRFTSAAVVTKDGYTVEAAIPFRTMKGAKGLVMGFDTQVNDADANGKRTGIMKWSDPLDTTYQDMSRTGSVILSD
jgi:endo-1,4-beta-xylanase